jgi:hypothetical protein
MGAGVERPCETFNPCPNTSGGLAAHGPLNNRAKDPGSLAPRCAGQRGFGAAPCQALGFQVPWPVAALQCLGRVVNANWQIHTDSTGSCTTLLDMNPAAPFG